MLYTEKKNLREFESRTAKMFRKTSPIKWSFSILFFKYIKRFILKFF